MASAHDELASLKMLATKGDGDRRITLVNHTGKTSMSCSLAEGIKVLASLVEKAHGSDSVHVVYLDAEKERKLTNPKSSTRRVFNCRTSAQWTEFNKALEPYYEGAGDPHIAIDLVIKALSAFSPETIKDWVKQEIAGEPEWPEFLQ